MKAEHRMNIECSSCRSLNLMFFTEEEWANYLQWKEGLMSIEDALPGWNKYQRELLISATCGYCLDDREAKNASN